MTLTYISCSSDFYTFYVNVPLSLGCMIPKVSAEAIRGNGTGLEYMCPSRHFVYSFFNPVFQVSTAKNEISLFNNHILIVAPVTFAPAGAMTPSAEFLSNIKLHLYYIRLNTNLFLCGVAPWRPLTSHPTSMGLYYIHQDGHISWIVSLKGNLFLCGVVPWRPLTSHQLLKG